MCKFTALESKWFVWIALILHVGGFLTSPEMKNKPEKTSLKVNRQTKIDNRGY